VKRVISSWEGGTVRLSHGSIFRLLWSELAPTAKADVDTITTTSTVTAITAMEIYMRRIIISESAFSVSGRRANVLAFVNRSVYGKVDDTPKCWASHIGYAVTARQAPIPESADKGSSTTGDHELKAM
tara:strand:+ start:1049 stop:1432 length:384 start_codon:yes stop_codon:yes gene_type:complete